MQVSGHHSWYPVPDQHECRSVVIILDTLFQPNKSAGQWSSFWIPCSRSTWVQVSGHHSGYPVPDQHECRSVVIILDTLFQLNKSAGQWSSFWTPSPCSSSIWMWVSGLYSELPTKAEHFHCIFGQPNQVTFWPLVMFCPDLIHIHFSYKHWDSGALWNLDPFWYHVLMSSMSVFPILWDFVPRPHLWMVLFLMWKTQPRKKLLMLTITELVFEYLFMIVLDFGRPSISGSIRSIKMCINCHSKEGFQVSKGE